MKKSITNMYTRLPIRITPLPLASYKPSHQLNRLCRSHTQTQPTSPLQPSASNSTPPCQSTHPAMCSRFRQPLSQVGLGIGTYEDKRRKSEVPKVCPVGRSVGRCKGSEALKVHVSSGTQAVSARRTSTESMSPLSDLPVLVPLVSPCTSTRES